MQKEDGCWKRIGVWGREGPRCPELERVVHCRNCRVFTRAGRNLLDRDLPKEHREESGQVLAAKKVEEPIGTISVVVFCIGGEWLALPSHLFVEIIEGGSIHSIPHRKDRVLLGISNVHGEIQLCVSLKQLIGLDEGDENSMKSRKPHPRMMVVGKDEDRWVFPVDEIRGVHRVHPNQFQNVPVSVSKSKSTFTKGVFKWKDLLVAFLDDELLFYSLKRSTQ